MSKKICPICKQEFGRLEEHHIKPRQILERLDISLLNKKYIVAICGSCHNRVYIPGENFGIHACLVKDSIIIHGWKRDIPNEELLWEDYYSKKIESTVLTERMKLTDEDRKLYIKLTNTVHKPKENLINPIDEIKLNYQQNKREEIPNQVSIKQFLLNRNLNS